MPNKILKLFTSLKLTVICLAFGIILVFVGTVAQADEGLYQAQARYFKHWFVFGITMFGRNLPMPLPGGYLIGSVLLVNLVASHISRFQWNRKKIGIHLTHLGIILLLLGQLVTDLWSEETQMRFVEGETKTYAESGTDYELAFISDADGDAEQVVAIPDRLLARVAAQGDEWKNDKLPFSVRVKSFWANSEPSFRPPMAQNGPPLTTNGIATSFDFHEAPLTRDMDSKNVPSVLVELKGATGSYGTWIASGWAGDDVMVSAVRSSYIQRKMSPEMAAGVVNRLTAPQVFTAGGKKFTMVLRPSRVYNPYAMTLLKTTHTVYSGTDIPKDFRSRVRIDNPLTHESREAEIFMNSPLRYAGLTYFQFQMGRDQMNSSRGSSTLQVVRNPAWLTPYAGCGMVAAGLVIQFMIHLAGFVSKRKAA